MLEAHQAMAADILDRADDIRKSVFYEIVAAGHDLIACDGDEFVLLVPDTAGLQGSQIGSIIPEIEDLVERVFEGFLDSVPGLCRLSPRSDWGSRGSAPIHGSAMLRRMTR